MARRIIPMESGERDRRVTIQQLTESRGSSKFPVETWSMLCTMYAGKFDVSTTERFKLDQMAARADVRWEVNYRADLDPDLIDVPKTRRLIYQPHGSSKVTVHDIVGASMIGRKEGIELMTIATTKVAS